jgi:hypothetical protein
MAEPGAEPIVGPNWGGTGHFHPVPTRPVFGQTPEQLAVPAGAPAPTPADAPGAPELPMPEDAPANSALRKRTKGRSVKYSSLSKPVTGSSCRECQ